MPHLNELQHIPNQHFKWNKARISYLTFMMIALLFKQTSNLAKLSTLFMNEAQPQSSYRRIQRFLSKHYIDFNHVAQFIFQLFHFNQVSLILDRTLCAVPMLIRHISKWRMSPWTFFMDNNFAILLSKWRMSPWTCGLMTCVLNWGF